MSAALYWWRATWRSSWRAAVTVALLSGLLGAVALGSLAAARRTASAYGRYLASINASDVFVNVPGALPGMPVTRPIELISRLGGISASSAYLGLDANPVVHGRVDDAFQTNGMTGSFAAPRVAAGFLQQDRVSVLAGRTPSLSSTDQIAITPGLARLFGVAVGGLPGHQRRLTIVGTVTLPSFGVSIADHVSLGQGAMMSEQALLIANGASSNPATGGEISPAWPSAVAIDLAPGTTQRKRLVRVIAAANPDGIPGGTYQLTQYRAAAVEDASRMGSQPLALALGLAAAAVLSLALTVLASVRRRRRELALLKTLGMTRRQLRAIVAWQTTFTLLIAVALGVPLGIAAGRLAWQAFAGSIGAVPVTAVPGLLLAAGAIILIVAGNVLTAGPAAVAASTDPAAALRAE